MVQLFGLSRHGPGRGVRRAPPPLQPGPRPPRQESLGERPNSKHIAASILFHLAVLFGIFLLPHAEPAEVVVPLVTLRLEENGAAGSAGGKAGGGGDGGHGTEASSAASQSANAEPPAEASAPTPPPPTPSIPTPPAPTPPTLDVRPEPQVPQALAPAPVIVPPPPKPPPPKPVVRPRPPAAKPTPRPPEKVAETPTPAPAPTIAAQSPPGPRNVQGAASPNAQPGTAATGTASGGPGGAAGVGTGVAGVGPGAFGNGKGPGDDYLDRLRRHLSRFKRYPAEAVKRKQQGTVLVTFVLARDGTVLEAQIQRSSGFPLLDQAALDMLHNASPVPALPASFTGDRARITIPADFSIGFFDRMFN